MICVVTGDSVLRSRGPGRAGPKGQKSSDTPTDMGTGEVQIRSDPDRPRAKSEQNLFGQSNRPPPLFSGVLWRRAGRGGGYVNSRAADDRMSVKTRHIDQLRSRMFQRTFGPLFTIKSDEGKSNSFYCVFDNPNLPSTDGTAVTAAKILQPRDVHVFSANSESVQAVPKMSTSILFNCWKGRAGCDLWRLTRPQCEYHNDWHWDHVERH